MTETHQAQTSSYPRVLIMHTSCIYEQDHYGLLFRTLFGDWPKTNVAQIYSGGAGIGPTFFGKTFNLGISERRFGHIFYQIKPGILKSSSTITVQADTEHKDTQQVRWYRRIRYKILCGLLSSGLWEIAFPPHLSEELLHWVQAFSPDVIYIQSGLAMAKLSMHLQEKLGIPIVFHPVDDWPNALYRGNPIMHQVSLRTARQLINRASVRIGFSQRMADGYKEQFGHSFEEVLMHGDDCDRFAIAEPERVAKPGEISVLYSGGLGLQRWQSLLDMCEAAQLLKRDNIKITISVYTSSIPPDAVNYLNREERLDIFPALTHEMVPSHFKGADILLLLEPFDQSIANNIRYSISTKAHLYMMSEVPILVYGSPSAGVVDYALQEGWGYVVPERNPDALADAVRTLSVNDALRASLCTMANKSVARHHVLGKNRKRFVSIMQRAKYSSAK